MPWPGRAIQEPDQASPALDALERLRSKVAAESTRLDELRAIHSRPPAGETAILAEVDGLISEGVLVYGEFIA